MSVNSPFVSRITLIPGMELSYMAMNLGFSADVDFSILRCHLWLKGCHSLKFVEFRISKGAFPLNSSILLD